MARVELGTVARDRDVGQAVQFLRTAVSVIVIGFGRFGRGGGGWGCGVGAVDLAGPVADVYFGVELQAGGTGE